MGNLNFFGQKPILFHTNEHIGHHVSATELVEVSLFIQSINIDH